MDSGTIVSLSLTEVVSVVVGALTAVGSLVGLVAIGYKVSHSFEKRFDTAVVSLEKSISTQFSTQDKTLALLQQSVTSSNQSMDGKLMQMAMDVRALQKNYDHLERKQQEDRLSLARVMERCDISTTPHHSSSDREG